MSERRGAGFLVGIGGAMPWAIALGMWAIFTPRFHAVFEDFGLTLAATTRVMIDVHVWLSSFIVVGPFFVGSAVVIVLVTVLAYSRWWVSLVVGLLGLLAMAGVVLSFFGALVKMIESLQAGGV